MTPEEWREDAVCRQVDPELWFPDRAGDNGGLAKQVCRSCPVRAQCLEYAIYTGQRYGIWGGVSAATLARLRNASKPRKPRNRVPVDRVLELSGRGWAPEAIAAAVGCTDRSVWRVLKTFRTQQEVA